MPQARKLQISLEDTPHYHCISRCVRRLHLCGKDKDSGKDFSHRKQWIEDRMSRLTDIFAIDISAFAILGNHTHIVLHVDVSQAKGWTDTEVLSRWHSLFKGTSLTRRFLDPAQRGSLSLSEYASLADTIERYRERLHSVSWFMAKLNEYIARRANKEEGCSGRFWEGRFKCRALLDEKALLVCMGYVDLNVLRAGLTTLPERGEHSSFYLRCKAAREGYQPTQLLPFVGKAGGEEKGLPFELTEYFKMVDQMGRCVRGEKVNSLKEGQASIMVRLGLDENATALFQEFEHHFPCAVGDTCSLQAFKQSTGRKRISGMASARRFLGGST